MECNLAESLEFSECSDDFGRPRILVLGCGGAGNNTVSLLVKMGITGAKTVAINTDSQHLKTVQAEKKILIGRKLIEAKKLTQDQAAQMFGVSQSRVSDLVRGKWEKFSLEMLITLATKAGMRISLNRAA